MKSLNPHRPDVKPGRGYRILECGECPQPGDEAKLGKAWLPVEAGKWKNDPFALPMNNYCVAVRTRRKPNAELCRTQGGVDSATDTTPPP